MTPPIPRFFSYDPNGSGLTVHETAEAAKQEATEAFDGERDQAIDGWSDEVTQICWGELRGAVEETSREETPGGDFDYRVEYALVDVPPPESAARLVDVTRLPPLYFAWYAEHRDEGSQVVAATDEAQARLFGGIALGLETFDEEGLGGIDVAPCDPHELARRMKEAEAAVATLTAERDQAAAREEALCVRIEKALADTARLHGCSACDSGDEVADAVNAALDDVEISDTAMRLLQERDEKTRRLEVVETQVGQLLSALEGMVSQHCAVTEDGGAYTGKLDSMADSSNAEAMHLLADHGRLIIDPPIVGRRIVGRWPEPEAKA
jgi:hypothetical protein